MKGQAVSARGLPSNVEVAPLRNAWRTVAPDQKVRKEPRFPFCYQIQVRGLDHDGNPFEEHSNTADISKTGCRFSLQTQVPRGSFLAISVQGEDGRVGAEAALYSVVWRREEGPGYEVGAEIVDGPNLWNITFPECGTGGW